jgi:predicted nucleotidyltransferase component of viral defense system
MFEPRYLAQVQLLVAVLPFVADETCFAIKGGTAINLFVREMPRLSVDIDLTYLPVEDRETTLRNVEAALRRIGARIELAFPDADIRFSPNRPMTRFDVTRRGTIKVEVSSVTRGCLFAPERRAVTATVEREFGYAEVPVVSFPDLYAGKICAALDRQHPRDWYDVKLLLDQEGIDRRLMQALLVYIASSGQPMNELLSPRWSDLRPVYEQHFVGMTRDPVPLEDLQETRERLLDEIARNWQPNDSDFLRSIKNRVPNWDLLGLDVARTLPALQWKLLNLSKMSATKHASALAKLESALDALAKRASS